MHDTFAFAFEKIIGESAWTKRTRRRILQVSNYSYPVLITGPIGSGRELIARAIHAHSPRADHPFIPFRCGAVPEPLRASQLFGQVDGAPGLARAATLGCFGAAEGGTLFLDEAGDLDQDSQLQLLFALREKRIVPFGAERSSSADVRLIASTSQDLDSEVQGGRFSFELLYRLNILPVTSLGLRDRVEDVEPLVRHWMARVTLENGLPLKQLTPAAMALLQSYEWPGNVDQLRSVVERAILFNDEHRLRPEAFSALMEEPDSNRHQPQTKAIESVNQHESILPIDVVDGKWQTLAQMEAEFIRSTLVEARYNQVVAARLLAIPLNDLMSKIAQHRIALSPLGHDAGAFR
ncbi:MAG: sigma 54-interacting transcriptional regulator [Pirellulaceae bacterium]|nr:sigma 54-interacting transcriptional regulator [Pirellulaceae bacterium]